MPRYGIAIDTTKCIGCHACRVACQNQNDLAVTEQFNKIVERERGIFPSFSREFIPLQCNHCRNAPCQRVCPTGATYTTPDEVVLVNEKTCVGCKYCIEACPYKMRILDHARGIVEKCRFCIEMVRDGGTPACVSTCPTQVRIFGDLDDPNSEVCRFVAQHRAQPLRPDLDTGPKIFYKRS
ncbi:MAG: 4Fe-4S dicluster domain-containing protein [Deltaproteobacteria bacterium]|nr:4Fe-4S dicluster domain-containing protein [Deltaproteobacteria bacterium]